MTDFPGSGLSLPPSNTKNSPEQIDDARRFVCSKAIDTADALRLLSALGIKENQ